MARPIWFMTVMLAAAFAAGCTASSHPDARASDSPPRQNPPTSGPTSDTLHGAPNSGACWRAPQRAFAADFWFDDVSIPVPCTQPHTSETVSVLELDQPTIKDAEQYVRVCWEQVHDYININADHWIPWGRLLYLPSRAQVAKGASWVRCDASFPADWGLSTNQTAVNFSARAAATLHAQQLQACLDKDPHNQSQPFVNCGGPHVYESTGKLAVLTGLTSYPSAATLQKEARQCRASLPPNQASAAYGVVAAWDSKQGLSGGELAGACFVHRTDGLPLR